MKTLIVATAAMLLAGSVNAQDTPDRLVLPYPSLAREFSLTDLHRAAFAYTVNQIVKSKQTREAEARAWDRERAQADQAQAAAIRRSRPEAGN